MINLFFFLILALLFPAFSAKADDVGIGSWEEYGLSLESPHDYPNSGFFVPIKIEGARKLKLVFSRIEVEERYDYVVVTDGNGRQIEKITGNKRDFTTREIPGDYAGIEIQTDSSTAEWGFKVVKVLVQY